jgi:hypothetical protein
MSKVLNRLEKIKNYGGDAPAHAEATMRLDPFIHKPEPTFWKRLWIFLTFDRIVIALFIFTAAFVLTYRAAVYERSEAGIDRLSIRDFRLPENSETDGQNAPANGVDFSSPEPAVHPAPSKPPTDPGPVEPVQPHFTVQLATYDRKERALGELEQLRQYGLDGFVTEGNKKYLLAVGKFGDKKSAEKKLREIRKGDFNKRYPDAYVRYVKD